jgi:hypothetical protein
MKRNKNLRTIGSVFAALAMLSSSQVKAVPVDTPNPTQNETKKQVAITPQERRKVYSKREIEPGGPTRDGIFFPGFHEPFFNPTRSERIKNKRTGQAKYFTNGKKRR